MVVPLVTRDDAVEPRCDKACHALAARAIEVKRAVVSMLIKCHWCSKTLKCIRTSNKNRSMYCIYWVSKQEYSEFLPD